MRVGIGIGSNLGDRSLEIERARAFLRELDAAARFSRTYESQPLDCPPDSGGFLNAAAEIEWEGGLDGLLDRLQAFETASGRLPAGQRGVNRPRSIDLDILYADGRVLRTERLVLPHPRLEERLFVLMPLAEISPGRRLPGDLETLREKCDRVRETLEKQGQRCRPC